MIAVSQSVAANFRGRVPRLPKRVEVILNAVELEKFSPDQNTRRQMRQELDYSGAEPVIGIVGQLTPRKGQLELLRAFARALKEIPTANLLIVGAPLFNRDDDYARLLEETVRELGISDRVRMIGERNDIPALMQALDLIVINSTVEPFGLVALEAMACGTPILAAISGGIPELIEHDVNGWLVRQGDEPALSAAIVKLVEHPELRARLARQGSNRITGRFSAERYLDELHSFYERHAGGKSTVNDKLPAGLQASGEIRLNIRAGGVR
jgi:glycosyltransferase involved in cell wall biosynthesis